MITVLSLYIKITAETLYHIKQLISLNSMLSQPRPIILNHRARKAIPVHSHGLPFWQPSAPTQRRQRRYELSINKSKCFH